MGLERLDRADRQRRADGEGHGARIPHLEGRDQQHVWQTLPPEILRSGQGIPAALRPGAIKVGPAVRRFYLMGVDQPSSLLVTDLAKRRDLFGGKATGFGDDRVDDILGEVAELAGGKCVAEPRDMLQREQDLFDRRLVHRFLHINPEAG
jgi:hypothetical protein